MTAAGDSSKRRIEFNLDWITRPVFGILLAAISIGSLRLGWPFAIVIGIGAVAAAREWHRMVGKGKFAVHWTIGGIAIAFALTAGIIGYFEQDALTVWPWIILAAGFAANLIAGFANNDRPAWQAFGVLYIGVPALLLVALRLQDTDGFWIVLGVFLAVWATDTGALVFGNLIGGPKLAPVLSPNKTWAGTIGGIIVAAVAEAVFVAVLGGDALTAALYGGLIACVAHAGDLFESRVKRLFQRKDSGGLIPGHGGMLDRVDSTLSAATAVAIAVFVFHLNPLFGAQL